MADPVEECVTHDKSCACGDARHAAEVSALRSALEEREADMHRRIRAGYDKTVADCWRARLAEVEAERDAARAELAAERAVSASLRAVVDVGAFMRDEYGAGRDDALARRSPASPSLLYRLGYAGGMVEREAKGDL